jgi:hypothetical protein
MDKTGFKLILIAPCGMNCGICVAHLREKNKCPGCRGSDKDKNISCVRCKIKNCSKLKKINSKFCFACKIFPCERILHLDKRYRTRYNMSMIENLGYIKDNGIRKFIKSENKRWKCPQGVICVHNKKCYKVI